MSKIAIDPNEGRVVIDLSTDTGPCEVSLDLFRAYNAYGSCFDKHEDPIALNTAWIEWLKGEGFPELSGTAACRIAKFVKDQMAEVKKNIVGSDSPKPA